jgi:hypothetical protein
MTDAAIALPETGTDAAPRRLFSRPSLAFAAVTGLLPNALFLAAMPFYIAERLLSPLLYLVAGLAALAVPRWLAYTLFLIAALLDLGLMIMAAFHLPINVAVDSIRYMASIDVAASAFYVGLSTAMIATALLTCWAVRRHRASFRAASPLPATMFALALMLLDHQVNFPYFASKAESQPFESAMTISGVAASGSRNILFVMVEGMGAFANPADRAVLTEKLASVTRDGRFTLEHGTSAYSGSTTGAESRELCGRWGDYQDYIGGARFDCLPRRLSARGYETVSYHGFNASMFDRNLWYPAIGFQRTNFLPEIVRDHRAAVPGRCGSVFTGLCDDELARVVHREMTRGGDQPKFVYWLTLNSHIPYVPKRDGRLDCRGAAPRIGNRTVCDLSEYWAEVMDAVAAIAADPALPPTDIIIAGDHHTPLWERDAKRRFMLGKVDWYVLRYRGAAAR